MKKIIVFICATVATLSSLNAHWDDHWIKAIQLQNEKKYVEAENEFEKALRFIDLDREEKHMHVHTDRALMYFEQERFYDALVDLNMALDSQKLVRKDRIDALKLRSTIYFKLDMKFRGQADYIEYASLDPNMPLIDYHDEYLVIRHCPQSEEEINALTWFFVEFEMCTKDDIKMYDNNICIVKLKKICCQDCKEKKDKEPCAQNHYVPSQKFEYCPIDNRIRDQKEIDKQLEKQIEGCNWYCDRTFDTCIAYIAKVQKRFWPLQVLITTAQGLKNKCYDCCAGNGGFYETCVSPIVKFCDKIMADYLKPDAWQDW